MTRLFELTGRSGLATFGRYVECVAPDPDAFFIRVHRMDLTAASVLRAHISPLAQTPIGTEFDDAISVTVLLSGSVDVDVPGRTLHLGPGQAYFDVGWGHRTSRHTAAVDVLVVMVPFENAAQRGIRLDPGAPVAYRGKPSLATRALAHIATPLVSGVKPAAAGSSSTYVESAILELVTGLYLETRGDRPGGREFAGSLHARAVLLIDQNFRDAELTAAAVAERLSVSSRTLHRAFEGTGSTPSRAIRNARCDYAETLLAGSLSSHLATAEVAESSGFPNATDLRRAIFARHSMAVRDFRELAATR